MKHWISAVAGVLIVGWTPLSASAKLCGDAVAGVDVPCACGDVVVSDLVLTDDPVTTSVCSGNGLVVRAAADVTRGVTIDLNGKTLRGSGQGTGVWVVYGGPGGARVISTPGSAAVSGFGEGVVAHGSNTIALVDRLRIDHSTRNGLRLGAADFKVHAIEVADSGQNGMVIEGRRFEIIASSVTRSKLNGYLISGAGGIIGWPGAGNVSLGSGAAGFSIAGVGHLLNTCSASGAANEGFRLTGAHFTITDCTADNNGLDGIAGTGMDWHFIGNRAAGNHRNGVFVRGAQMVDGGGNNGAGNGDGWPGHLIVQCTINGIPCAQ